MEPRELETAILAFVQRSNYRPSKPRVIAQRLGILRAELPLVKKAVKRLMARGSLRYGPNHLVLPGESTPVDGAAKRKQRPPREESPRAESSRRGGLRGPAETAVSEGAEDSAAAMPEAFDAQEAAAAWEAADAWEDVEESAANESATDEPWDAEDAGESEPPEASEDAGEHVAFAEPDEFAGRRKSPKLRKSGSNRVIGTFRRAEGGFGFVRPESVRSSERTADIYVPAEKAGDAASGDIVAVRVKKGDGRRGLGPRGEIVEIIERQTSRFVGTYFESRGSAYVQVDGPLFTKPISVGDPGAHNVRSNDKVVVEMVRFPSPISKGEGVIVEVLGERGRPGVDTLSVLREFDLPDRFPEKVLEDARRQAEAFDETVLDDRCDATGETVITIDPADARDFDDAISLEKTDRGHWRLGVHIADVSHFVPLRSPLDREAFQRATSVYLPDRVVPMLPEIISNGLASLQPDKVRYTKTAYLEFTAEGIRVNVELRRTAIKSCRRFTYEEVDEFLADPEAWREKLTPAVHDLLMKMRELAAILRKRRKTRGSLELTMPEVKIDLDRDGRVAGAHVVPYTESHQMIEEFMVSANEAVAESLAERKLHFLRRIHQAPKLEKLETLAEFVEELGLPAEGLHSRFAIQQLLDAVVGRPEQYAVNYAVLRSLQRAVYSPQEEGHFALAADCYCHFTSPIRRYPDLTIHRLVDALIQGRKVSSHYGRTLVLGEHCSQREQRAEAAERELTKLKLLDYLSTRIGEQMDAVVTGVEGFGLFAQGLRLPAEGLIHVNSLVDDFYRFDRATHSLTGNRSGNTFRLGDVIRVEVARVDLERRELDFRIVGKGSEGEERRRVEGRRRAAPDREERSGRERTGRARTGREHPAIVRGGRKPGKKTDRPAKTAKKKSPKKGKGKRRS